MLVVVSDTHQRERPDLTNSLREAIRKAEIVVHAGDFTSEAILDEFQSISAEFSAVHGNRDTMHVKERLSETGTLEFASWQIGVIHTQRGGAIGLRYFGEEQAVDLVISGHTHQAHFDEGERVSLLNPGSHTSPRGTAATYAVLRDNGSSLAGEIRTVDGAVRRQFDLEGR